jgi:hypothetical protein
MQHNLPARFHAAQQDMAALLLVRLVAAPPVSELLASLIIPAKDEAETYR